MIPAGTLVREVLRDAGGQRTWDCDREAHLQETIGWLARSQDVTGGGGSAAAYNLVLGWQDAFPETTGYIVETMYDYAEWAIEHGDNAAATDADRRAEEMAEWLLPLQAEDGSFQAYDTLGGDTEPTVFDTGMITFGLVRQYEETGDERFRVAAVDAARWLADVQESDGHWERYSYNDTPHAYTSRVSWAMLEAAAVAEGEDAEYIREHARRHQEWVCSCQHPNGWFEQAGFTGDQTAPFLHTIAYTIRGLLEADAHFEDERLGAVAKKSADVLLKRHQREGILAGAYDAAWRGADYYCLTGNAQMAIVWLKLYQQTGETAYQTAAEETIDFLTTTQRLDGPDGVRGAIKGSLPVWGRYMYLRYPNWAAKFFADALLLAERTN